LLVSDYPLESSNREYYQADYLRDNVWVGLVGVITWFTVLIEVLL